MQTIFLRHIFILFLFIYIFLHALETVYGTDRNNKLNQLRAYLTKNVSVWTNRLYKFVTPRDLLFR